MNCMKCGRDIPEDQVFCSDCLEVMARYPVKPGTAVQLPRKADTPAPRKQPAKRRQPPAPEEQIRVLKKRVRRFVALWLVTLTLLLAALYPAGKYILSLTGFQLGQNYSTFTDATEP